MIRREPQTPLFCAFPFFLPSPSDQRIWKGCNPSILRHDVDWWHILMEYFDLHPIPRAFFEAVTRRAEKRADFLLLRVVYEVVNLAVRSSKAIGIGSGYASDYKSRDSGRPTRFQVGRDVA